MFDRGNNSIKNLAKLERHKYYYAGALTPSDHKELIEEAENNFTEVSVNGIKYQAYKVKKNIWDYERTVVVYISENLKAGQLAGIYQSLEKKKNPKVRYILESMETEEQEIVKALKIEETHIKRPKIKGIGVYNSKPSER